MRILFFITIKIYKMKVYIVQLDDELKIFKVQPEDEANFLEDRGHQVLAVGETMQEAIFKFAALQENQEQ